MPVRTLRFPAKLNRTTHAALERFLEDQRILWNAALQERIDAYGKCGKSISAYDQCKSLTAIRRDDAQHYARISVDAQRSILFRLDKAFRAFFGRVKRGEKPGFPRYRSRRRAVRSFETDAFRVHRQGSWQAVTIKGIGRFRFRGEVAGTAKVLRIVRSPRRVEVQFVVEMELPQQDIADDSRAPVGIDVGIRARVALSGGDIVPGTTLDRARLRHRQRRVSRARRGSNARRKKVCALAKEWQRVTERERGRLHELTSRLVREQGPRCYVEDLRILNMTKNHSLARAILEQTWGAFVTLLAYKAEDAGGWVRRVPAQGTSQRCSACGALPSTPLGLGVRTYRCAGCGHVADRDVNAAKNILSVGLALDWPGGEPPVCREAEGERGARSATTGARRDSTEQYRRAV